MQQKQNFKGYLLPFILVTSLFFLWGIANNLNGILIPHLRKALQLSNTQSTLVDTAVYLAYFLMAIPAGMLIEKFGYKKGIITGLVIFAIGAFLFIPAANSLQFGIFLLGLFIIGNGLTILETAANPYATKLGPEETSTSRLTLAQSFNGLAAFVGPMIGAMFILSGKEHTPEELAAMTDATRHQYFIAEAASVKMPYAILGGFLLLLAFVFSLLKFPEFKSNTEVKGGTIRSAWQHGHLRWAVIAQLFYVGAQVCVTSFFVRAVMTGGGLDEKTAGYYLSVYGLLFMGGRFLGSLFFKFIKANKLLTIYSIMCILLGLAAIFLNGNSVVYSLGALGFFMSIMFPTIFSLGIKDLDEDTKAGSSLLVMSVIGGAVFPVIMGFVIDRSGVIQYGYIIPVICYVVVLLFSIYGYRPKIKQEI